MPHAIHAHHRSCRNHCARWLQYYVCWFVHFFLFWQVLSQVSHYFVPHDTLTRVTGWCQRPPYHSSSRKSAGFRRFTGIRGVIFHLVFGRADSVKRHICCFGPVNGSRESVESRISVFSMTAAKAALHVMRSRPSKGKTPPRLRPNTFGQNICLRHVYVHWCVIRIV